MSDGLTGFSSVVRRIALAVGFLLAGIAVYVLFVRTEAGQQFDASSFGAVMELRAAIGDWADSLRNVLTVVAGVMLLALLIIAIVQQRLRDATMAAAVTVVALVLSTVLKSVLERPFLGEFGYLSNTFPSSRAAVTVAALIGSYWLLRGRLRHPVVLVPLIVLGSATGLFQVVSYAHRPADVFGGALAAGMIAALLIGRGGALAAGWRWSLWGFVVVTAVLGGLLLWSWESSGYATPMQSTGTLGILLASAAVVTAALAIGAERPIERARSRP